MSLPKITQQNMIRRDRAVIDNQLVLYEASIEKLRLGTKKIMEDIHTILQNQIDFYISTIDLRDQNQLMGAEIMGYTFLYERPSVKVGEHFVARKHPKIPQGKMEFKDFYEYRDTYSFDSHEWKYCLEGISGDPSMALENLRSQQMAAFIRGRQNFLAFISYMIFHCPSRGKGSNSNGDVTKWAEKLDCSESKGEGQSRKDNGPKKTGSEYRKKYKDWAEPEFEAYIEFIFNPENASTNGYPVAQQNLVLEKTYAVTQQKNFVTVNKLLNKIKEIRKKLRETKPITYDKHSSRFYKIDEINHEVCDSLSLREKIMWTAKDMVFNPGEYMVDIDQYGKYNPPVKPSDLVLIVSYKDLMNLQLGIPSDLEPKNWKFTPEELGVGKIIDHKWMPKGEALILHKDLIKLWITDMPVGEAEYKEHSVTNTWMDLMFYFDMVSWWGCAYIHPANEPSSS